MKKRTLFQSAIAAVYAFFAFSFVRKSQKPGQRFFEDTLEAIRNEHKEIKKD